MSREEIGTLIVVILKARNLNDKHKFRKQDVFAKVSLNGVEQKTKVDVKGGQHPVWDDEVRFPVYKAVTGKFRTAEISVWSKEPRDDDLLGKASLDISKIIETGEFDEWVPLAIDETVRGDIYLEITYYSHGPPPPQAQSVSPKPSTLAVPQVASGMNLQRRASKLNPSDRLSRPTASTPQPGHPQAYQNHAGFGVPSSPYGKSPPYQQAPLPPVPESQSSPPKHAPPPNLLRPGTTPTPRPYYDGIGPVSPTRPGMHESSSMPPPAKHNPYLTPAPSYNRTNTTPASPQQTNPYLASTSAPNLYTQASSIQATPQIYPPTTNGLYGQQVPPPQSYTPVPQQQQQSPPPAISYNTTPLQQQQQQQQPPPISYTPAPQQQQPPPLSYTPAPQQQPYPPPPSQTPVPSGPPLIWSDTTTTATTSSSLDAVPGGGFFFPTPNVHPNTSDTPPYPHSNNSNGWGNSNNAPSSPYDYDNGLYNAHRRTASDPRADPALISRYATPLPLPPGATRPSERERERERESRWRGRESELSSSPPPRPPPKPHSPSPVRPPKQQQQQQHTSTSPGPTNERLQMLKRAEEEATRRREQEKRDMELAMALDRELNL